jgi:hypothetical protein
MAFFLVSLTLLKTCDIRKNIGYTKYIRKVKIQSPENICKAFFGGFTCSTFTAHLYLLFNVVAMDRNAFSEPGKEEFSLFQRRRNPASALLAMENSSCHFRIFLMKSISG